ncbi:hypothetical protein CSC70_01845 [Pseudoxanthomonas kalamensis DSM 18571]|nr:hypothetical protein CSC70_01845 [Pseudoxanthomonas kalamensis DSM 18571]
MALLALAASASAQQPAKTPSRSLYAVNSAAIASAMTYCMTKHGPLRTGSPGADCFARARNVLAEYGLHKVADGIDGSCRDPATFNTCLTPQIGRLVYALNAEFAKREL